MGILSGYMQRYTGVKTVGLCHSVQVCSEKLLEKLDMKDKLEGRVETIAGINHMAWLLDIKDKDGNDYGWAKVLDYIGVGWEPTTIGDNCKGQMSLPLDQMI